MDNQFNEDFLRYYQKDCLEKVMSRLNEGARHLSVVMSVGLGRKSTSLFLARRLCTGEQDRVAMVFRAKMDRMQTQAQASNLGITSVDFYSVNDFLRSSGDYRYIIFHDLSTRERKQLEEHLKDRDCTTFVFYAPFQEVTGEHVNHEMNQHLMAVSAPDSGVVCVYVTNEVLDVRDARYAGPDEIVFVNRENLTASNWLLLEREQTATERDSLKNRSERLQTYMSALKQITAEPAKPDASIIEEQAAEIERLKALLQADDRNRKIEELEAREAEYQEQIREKDARIAQQDQMITFQQDILSAFGIDADVIRESFEQIQAARAALRSDLESDDDEAREIALKKLQDKVAEIVSGLTRSALPANDYKYFEDYLIGELSEEVWDRLDDKSRTFLITAKSNYESMVNMKDREAFDYSGVCLLVTKTLEVETAKRFFVSYKEYLQQKYNSVAQWPYALRQRYRGQITQDVIPDSEFTLGSVVSVIGMKRNYDADGNITSYSVAHMGTKNDFIDYARQDLFKFSDWHQVEAEIDKDYHFIERVRLDYRNPSAHRDRLTITSAQNCLQYVIEVQHMLREMLTPMKI